MYSKNNEPAKLFSVKFEDGKQVSLLQALEDVPRYFGKRASSPLPFPESFSLPRSFEYHMNLGIVTNLAEPSKVKVYEGSQSTIVDSVHNRVKIERETRIFHEKDVEHLNFDFEKMRLLVSDPTKQLCLGFKMVDISPVSMMPREND